MLVVGRRDGFGLVITGLAKSRVADFALEAFAFSRRFEALEFRIFVFRAREVRETDGV
jgi:hypothetical protein